MSTSADHYLEAERLIRIAADLTHHRLDEEAGLFQLAQVHATLALAAATALSQGFDGPPIEDYDAWIKAASVIAPIPPETDDEDDTIRVGDLSPTGDMHPDALQAWLTALPHRTILRDINGDPYQISTGYETAHRSPDREFPALVELGGRPNELTRGHHDLVRLAKLCAPFTVLALGDAAQERR